jgi:integrase
MRITGMSDLIPAHLAHITAAGYSRQTITKRGELLRRVDHALPYGLEQATVEELAGWLARPEWSRQSRATYYGHIRGFFSWACNPLHPLLDFDPSAALTRPRRPNNIPRPISDQQLEYMLGRAEDPFRLWILLAAQAGLRCAEIATIRREDFTEEAITVRGKGGKEAPVPTHPDIWAAVSGLPPGRLVKLTAEQVSNRSRTYFRHHLGLTGVGLHRCRHWLGTTVQRQTGNLRITQELLRHGSPTTTAGYAQVTDRERRAAIHALPILRAARS